MGFVAALPVMGQAAIGLGAISTVAGIQQAGAAGKYNQAVQNRNAQVAEQEAAQIEKQKEFDIARFDQQFVQLQGQTKTRVLFSGAELSGSGLRILRRNAEQAEVEKNIIDYNAKIGQAQKFEEANFARIQGSMARQQARMQQLQLASSFGTSLLGAAK
jgi:flagellar motility protein MotE (MotC chaperone)